MKGRRVSSNVDVDGMGISSSFDTGTRSRLVVRPTIHGPERSGKTTLASTLPGRGTGKAQGWLPLDINTRATLEGIWKENGKPDWFQMPSADLLRKSLGIGTAAAWDSGDEKVQEECKQFYQDHLSRVYKVYSHYVTDDDVVSIILDTGTQLVEDFTYAAYGRNSQIMPRDRAAPFQKFKDFVLSSGDKHVAIVCWDKEKYVKNEATGVYVPRLPTNSGYLTNLQIRTLCPQTREEAQGLGVELGLKGLKSGTFLSQLLYCGANPLLIARDENIFMGDMSNMMTVLSSVYPERELGDFGYEDEEVEMYVF